MKFETVCIHAGHEQDPEHAHLTPVYASSTYTFENAAHAEALFTGKKDGYIYGRFGNPTIREAEMRIAAMETFELVNAQNEPLQAHAILHASGMAAITTLLIATLKSGDKILTHQSLYGGTQELLDKILPELGITYVVADFKHPTSLDAVIQADPAIKMMYIETPANPTLQCFPIESLVEIAKRNKLLTTCDNTFATPYLQQPFKFEADFIIHSTTKFLNGHGTAVGGVLLGTDIEFMRTRVTKTARLLGGNSNAWDAFLLVNGMRTLKLRMDQHCKNAEEVARFLNDHPKVTTVNYLGLWHNPDHALARAQMRHPGAVMSFELAGGLAAAQQFLNAVKLCTHAVSLGTCDTLVSHPASTTHFGVPQEVRLQAGISDGLIRMSVGLEAAEDIIDDLKQALETITT